MNNLDAEHESSAYLKRHLTRMLERLEKRDEDETQESIPDDDDDDDNSGNNASGSNNNNNDDDKSYGEGIFVPIGGGGRINICTEQYVTLAGDFHPQMKELMKTACQGSQSTRFLLLFFFYPLY